MKLKNPSLVITICVVVCVIAAIGFSVARSWEAHMAFTLPLEFVPEEFSTDGGETWQPMGDELRKQRCDIAIRGHFNYDIMEGWNLNFYFPHLQMELLVNDQLAVSYAREFHQVRPEWCTDIWICFQMPEIKTDDVVEIRLYSLHPSGMKMGAYEKVLSSITLGEPFYVYQTISAQNSVDQYTGLSMLIIGVVLFGLACVALFMRSPLQKIMMYTALLAVGEGMFWLADAAEIAHYVSGSIVFFSTGRYVSRILCVYALLATLAELVNSKAKISAQAAAYTYGLASIGYLILNITGVVSFCEAEVVWYCIQALPLLVGFGSCLWELTHVRMSVWETIRLLTLGLVHGSILYDLGTLALGFHTELELSKWMCGTVAALHAAALLVQLPASYAAIRRAKNLADELHNNRIVLAMSQIRTHFVFNVLNAISSLCKSDPEQADMQIVRFSRYLRNNIDIMQEDRLIPFEKALEHMHNYVDLEQLRFGDKIFLDEHFEYTDFFIPSLVIQPLVENSIKHGLLPKAEGGIIRVSTSHRGSHVLIEITDNGIGFDTSQKIAKTSVGLSNVRFRVEKMMNGRMQVESTPGVGTQIRLWLPLRKEESASASSV